jgi:hypothetical protein
VRAANMLDLLTRYQLERQGCQHVSDHFHAMVATKAYTLFWPRRTGAAACNAAAVPTPVSSSTTHTTEVEGTRACMYVCMPRRHNATWSSVLQAVNCPVGRDQRAATAVDSTAAPNNTASLAWLHTASSSI